MKSSANIFKGFLVTLKELRIFNTISVFASMYKLFPWYKNDINVTQLQILRSFGLSDKMRISFPHSLKMTTRLPLIILLYKKINKGRK